MSLRSSKDLSLETMHGDLGGKAGGTADVIHRICCPSGLFSSILLVIITLTLQILGKHSGIIKGNRDNNEGVLHYKILILKFWVTISRCSINKGDIIEVRVY